MKRTVADILALPEDALLGPEDLTVWFGLPKSWIRQHSGDEGCKPRIPAVKIGKYWRYRKGTVLEWLQDITGVVS